MTSVVVDGVSYYPGEEGQTKPLVAIAITTRNRHDVLMQTLKNLRAVTPPEFLVFVVDDASTAPVHKLDTSGLGPIEHFRFDSNVGIPQAKNKCIELCEKSGAEHFFLLDDDCYPVVDGWWRAYVESGEAHLNYIFTHWTNGTPVGDCREIYNDGKIRAFDQARGCAMYLRRIAVQTVGGFNPRFGIGMNEHLEYSQRVCNAGLSTFPYMDVTGSDELWHSLDRAQTVTRSIPAADRQALLIRNNEILESLSGSTEFVPFKAAAGNLVITQLLTSNIDGQSGVQWAPDPNLVKVWSDSLRDCDGVVLTDQISMASGSVTAWHKMSTGWKIPHLQRWVSSLEYLRTHDAQWVWLTDGTDVEMLNAPWDEMEENTLYVGDEPCTISKPWLAEHHPFYRKWIGQYPRFAMLNCGVVGGDRATVLEFLGDLVRELARAYGQIDYEMGSFNYVAQQNKWFGRVEHGPHVTTTFKANERTSAWWKHK